MRCSWRRKGKERGSGSARAEFLCCPRVARAKHHVTHTCPPRHQLSYAVYAAHDITPFVMSWPPEASVRAESGGRTPRRDEKAASLISTAFRCCFSLRPDSPSTRLPSRFFFRYGEPSPPPFVAVAALGSSGPFFTPHTAGRRGDKFFPSFFFSFLLTSRQSILTAAFSSVLHCWCVSGCLNKSQVRQCVNSFLRLSYRSSFWPLVSSPPVQFCVDLARYLPHTAAIYVS